MPGARRERQQRDAERTGTDDHLAQAHDRALRDEERADQRPHAEHGIHERVLRSPLCNAPLDEQGQHDGEVYDSVPMTASTRKVRRRSG